jgi:hypothetical protein
VIEGRDRRPRSVWNVDARLSKHSRPSFAPTTPTTASCWRHTTRCVLTVDVRLSDDRPSRPAALTPDARASQLPNARSMAASVHASRFPVVRLNGALSASSIAYTAVRWANHQREREPLHDSSTVNPHVALAAPAGPAVFNRPSPHRGRPCRDGHHCVPSAAGKGIIVSGTTRERLLL